MTHVAIAITMEIMYIQQVVGYGMPQDQMTTTEQAVVPWGTSTDSLRIPVVIERTQGFSPISPASSYLAATHGR